MPVANTVVTAAKRGNLLLMNFIECSPLSEFMILTNASKYKHGYI